MKHAIFATALFPLATPLWADDIRLNAPVTAATLYSEGATLTRAVPFSASAGRHDLLITNLPESLDPMSVRVALDGAKLGAVTVRHERVYPHQQDDSPELAAAKSELELVENDWQAASDSHADVMMTAEVARARLAYLSTLQGPTETAAPPDVLKETMALVGRETLAAHRDIATAERDARQYEKQLEELRQPLEDARQLVEALTPTESDNAMLAISISADAATEGTLTLTHLTQFARWVPAYDVHLNTSDTPQLSIERGAFVSQFTDEDWTDVALTLSTSRPDAQSDPSGLYPWRRHIEEKQQLMQKPASGRFAELDMSAAAPQMELAVVEDAAAYSFGDGINATYVYPTPVSVSSASDALHLALGTLDLSPDTYAFANPMRDETAFLMAKATNDAGELILPSPQANFYLNGTYIGQQEMPLIAEGDDIDFSFGPINGLRLTDTITNKITGDKGVLTSRNEQSETRVLTAENLTNKAWDLRLLGRVPYSEQEDLVISHQASPSPTETNFEDQRGILMWEHTLPAGKRFEVELSHKIQWPSEMILR
ncbi:MAG: DUF4139 domain-containing protein [Shimia sp.]|uniref:DUF4139 domain-containing protein n=1 Tax=Shimia sp. TaxID=1954381 RepID=UPI003B8C54D1